MFMLCDRQNVVVRGFVAYRNLDLILSYHISIVDLDLDPGDVLRLGCRWRISREDVSPSLC
jgi:hypothetical protein